MILRGENKQYNSFCIVNFYQDYKLKKENKENEELQVWLQLNNWLEDKSYKHSIPWPD